jgi:hypothetical protein
MSGTRAPRVHRRESVSPPRPSRALEQEGFSDVENPSCVHRPSRGALGRWSRHLREHRSGFHRRSADQSRRLLRPRDPAQRAEHPNPGLRTSAPPATATSTRVSEPFRPWNASPMGQAARDPLFWAAVAIANQDAAFGRRHLHPLPHPGRLARRATARPPTGPAPGHRLPGRFLQLLPPHGRPQQHPGAPAEDAADPRGLTTRHPDRSPLRALRHRPRRPPARPARAPGLLRPRLARVPLPQVLRDVRDLPRRLQPPLRAPARRHLRPRRPPTAPTSNSARASSPSERTYSEWLMSDFADGPIDMGGRFGGNNPLVSSCQDCHMPAADGLSCIFGDFRSDLATPVQTAATPGCSTPSASSTTTPRPGSTTSPSTLRRRTVEMLENASDVELTADASTLNVKVINQTGHKLPTGYPEGRRMWVNVQFFDAKGALVDERGAYDFGTGDLDTSDTKVYEMKLGVSPDVAAIRRASRPGEGFHFASTTRSSSTTASRPAASPTPSSRSVQAEPVNYTYADGEHWDDTDYTIPAGAASADRPRLLPERLQGVHRVPPRREHHQRRGRRDVPGLARHRPVRARRDGLRLHRLRPAATLADIALPYGVLDLSDLQGFIAAFLPGVFFSRAPAQEKSPATAGLGVVPGNRIRSRRSGPRTAADPSSRSPGRRC